MKTRQQKAGSAGDSGTLKALEPIALEGRHTHTAIIVDDTEATRNLLMMILEGTPLTVVAAASSTQEALILTHRLHPEVVIVDRLVPGAEKSLTEDLRRQAPGIKVIFSTTHLHRHSPNKQAIPEADEYILRPYHRTHVRERVMNVCRSLGAA